MVARVGHCYLLFVEDWLGNLAQLGLDRFLLELGSLDLSDGILVYSLWIYARSSLLFPRGLRRIKAILCG